MWKRLAVAGAGGALLLGASQMMKNTQQPAELTQTHSPQLKQVQAVFRHGARTPLTPKYWAETGAIWNECEQLEGSVRLSLRDLNGGPQPLSTHNAKQEATKLPGGCSKGQLTVPGQRQARELGEWLRQRYVRDYPLLPEAYSAEAIGGRTTNYQRSIATINGLLTGLYPGTTKPISVVTAEEKRETLFGNTDACERLRGLFKHCSDGLQALDKSNAHLKSLEGRLRTVFSLPKSEKVSFLEAHDAASCLAFHGKALPAGLTSELRHELDVEATRRILSLVAPEDRELRREVLRLSMGPLVSDILTRLKAAAGASPDAQQLYLYSGHDTTVMPLLVLLGTDLDQWTEYLTSVVFELWEERGMDGKPTHYVKALMNRKELPLHGSAPGAKVSLGELEKLWQPYLTPYDAYLEECKVPYEKLLPAPKSDGPGGDAFGSL